MRARRRRPDLTRRRRGARRQGRPRLPSSPHRGSPIGAGARRRRCLLPAPRRRPSLIRHRRRRRGPTRPSLRNPASRPRTAVRLPVPARIPGQRSRHPAAHGRRRPTGARRPSRNRARPRPTRARRRRPGRIRRLPARLGAELRDRPARPIRLAHRKPTGPPRRGPGLCRIGKRGSPRTEVRRPRRDPTHRAGRTRRVDRSRRRVARRPSPGLKRRLGRTRLVGRGQRRMAARRLDRVQARRQPTGSRARRPMCVVRRRLRIGRRTHRPRVIRRLEPGLVRLLVPMDLGLPTGARRPKLGRTRRLTAAPRLRRSLIPGRSVPRRIVRPSRRRTGARLLARGLPTPRPGPTISVAPRPGPTRPAASARRDARRPMPGRTRPPGTRRRIGVPSRARRMAARRRMAWNSARRTPALRTTVWSARRPAGLRGTSWSSAPRKVAPPRTSWGSARRTPAPPTADWSVHRTAARPSTSSIRTLGPRPMGSSGHQRAVATNRVPRTALSRGHPTAAQSPAHLISAASRARRAGQNRARRMVRLSRGHRNGGLSHELRVGVSLGLRMVWLSRGLPSGALSRAPRTEPSRGLRTAPSPGLPMAWRNRELRSVRNRGRLIVGLSRALRSG